MTGSASASACAVVHNRLITGHNEVVAKVMFLQVCVCPQEGGRVSASVHAGMRPPRSRPPWTRQTPPDQADPFGTRQTRRTKQTPPDQADPPGSTLQHMVYEQLVRILLECILVTYATYMRIQAPPCTSRHCCCQLNSMQFPYKRQSFCHSSSLQT